ncbi:hypothetical protein GOODEAATRI_003721, partial [Goodea atripinnis]
GRHSVISSAVVHWGPAYSNGRLWLACAFACEAVSCHNIHLARVQLSGGPQ